MTGSNEASLTLSVRSDRTRIRLHYKCLLKQTAFFSMSPLWLSIWIGVWAVMIALCCLSSCWIVRHRRNPHRRRGHFSPHLSTEVMI